MEEKKLAKLRKNNMKIYPTYKMLGLDYIFYYGIKILFLTQVKNISPADIVLASSFYSFCHILFQVFSTIIVEKVGKKKAIVLGQFFNLLSMGATLYCPNYIWLLFSSFLSSIGFGLKGIAESSILSASIPKGEKKGEIFSKIDSKGYRKYCFICASSTLLSGFLYAINPYIPIILSMIITLMALIISTNFVDIERIENPKQETDFKEEIKVIISDVKEGFKFIFKSSRLRTLLIFLGVLWGIISVYATYQETLLKELNIPSYYIGFMLAGFQILVGIFSTKSITFNRKYKNNSLTYIGLMLAVGSIVLGITTIANMRFEIQLMIVTGVFILRAYAKGLYQVLKKRYMNNFSNDKVLPKIYSVNGITTSVGNMIIGIIASAILKTTTLPYALLILGIISTVIILVLYVYSKNKLGLDEKEYNPKDICN